MQRRIRSVVLFILVIALPLFSAGQDSDATKKAFEKAVSMSKDIEADTAKESISTINTDRDLLKRSNEYNFMHQQRSFTWQYYSGIVIFFLVVVIVGMGLVLSYQQFKLNERLVTPVKTTVITDAANNTTEQTTSTALAPAAVFTTSTMEIGKDGLKINTAVIGLIILSLSIAFFFLYLKYVYPVTFVS
jgi:cytochrome c-type biogenesis protein CcmH/NrfG